MSAPVDRPTRTSTAVAIAIALGLVVAFLRAADVLLPGAVAAAGAAALAGLLWASRGGTPGAFLTSVLALPAGIGLLAATLGTYLVLAAEAFPVGPGGTVRTVAFEVVVTTVLVTACAVAVFGALATGSALFARERLKRATRSVTLAAGVLIVPGALAGLQAGLTYLQANAAGPGPGEVVAAWWATADALVLDPAVATPHAATFALLVGLAVVAVGLTVGVLPHAALVGGRPDGERWIAALERTERVLTVGGLALLVAAVPLGVLELLAPGALPGALAGVVASGAIRSVAAGVAVVCLLGVGIVTALRRTVRSAGVPGGALVAPLAGGLLVGALVVWTAEQALAAGVAWTVAALPGQFGEVTGTIANSLIDVYGPVTVGLLVVGTLLLAVATLLAVVWGLAVLGVVDGRAGGGRVAGAGLVLAAATGAVVGLSRPLVLAGVVGGIVVADLDVYASRLGREVGRAAGTARAELLHGLGTLLVAGVGAAAAVGLAGLSLAPAGPDPAVALVGLLAALVGTTICFAALR